MEHYQPNIHSERLKCVREMREHQRASVERVCANIRLLAHDIFYYIRDILISQSDGALRMLSHVAYSGKSDATYNFLRDSIQLFSESQIQHLISLVGRVSDVTIRDTLSNLINEGIGIKDSQISQEQAIKQVRKQKQEKLFAVREMAQELKAVLEEMLIYPDDYLRCEYKKVLDLKDRYSVIGLDGFSFLAQSALSHDDFIKLSQIVHIYISRILRGAKVLNICIGDDVPEYSIHPFVTNIVKDLLPIILSCPGNNTGVLRSAKKAGLTRNIKPLILSSGMQMYLMNNINKIMWEKIGVIYILPAIIKNIIHHGMFGRFARVPFVKSDSKTTLLFGVPLIGKKIVKRKTLMNRAIVRHLYLGPAIQWARAYTAVELWEELGFDYIPIEPILGVQLAKNTGRDVHSVNVLSSVVKGYNFSNIEETCYPPAFWYRQKETIRHGLSLLGIEHGHWGSANVLVDIQRIHSQHFTAPRMFAIDFDLAHPER